MDVLLHQKGGLRPEEGVPDGEMDLPCGRCLQLYEWDLTGLRMGESILLVVFGATLAAHVYVFKSKKFRKER